MKITRFEDIKAWQLARELNKSIYELTLKPVFRRDFGLRDQLQRASVSVALNIAEGFDSGSKKHFINFLRFSFRSTGEVKTILYLALDVNYISKEEFEEFSSKVILIRKLITGLRKYLVNSA